MKKLFQIKYIFLAVVAGAMLMVMFMFNAPILHASDDWYQQQKAEQRQRDAGYKEYKQREMERKQEDMERRQRDIERKQRDIEDKQQDMERKQRWGR